MNPWKNWDGYICDFTFLVLNLNLLHFFIIAINLFYFG